MSARNAALVLSVLLASAGCAVVGDEKAARATTKVKAVAVDYLDDGKQTVLSVASVQDGGLFFTRPPLDMNGPWRVDVTAGILDTDDVAKSAGALFSLEVDRRESGTNVPSQFYGISARRFLPPDPDVLQVYAYSHGGVGTQTTFPGVNAAELVVASDGSTVTYFARPAGTNDSYTALGSVALASPGAPHQPGFGTFSAPKGARLGFTEFRVNANDSPVDATPYHTTARLVMEAALAALAAAYEVDQPVVDSMQATAANDLLAAAQNKLNEARNVLAGAGPPGKKSDQEKAVALLERAEAEVAAARNRFATDGAAYAPKFVKTVAKPFYGRALAILKLMLPEDLRAFLPGEGW